LGGNFTAKAPRTAKHAKGFKGSFSGDCVTKIGNWQLAIGNPKGPLAAAVSNKPPRRQGMQEASGTTYFRSFVSIRGSSFSEASLLRNTNQTTPKSAIGNWQLAIVHGFPGTLSVIV
jgi:hypothetical protein